MTGSKVVCKPGDGRFWASLLPLREFSLSEYIKALFTARSGRFRVIVFLLSINVRQDSKVPGEETATNWSSGGLTKLPPTYGRTPFSDQYACTALIYEFEKKDYSSDAQTVVPGKIKGMAHLVKAGIWGFLSK